VSDIIDARCNREVLHTCYLLV